MLAYLDEIKTKVGAETSATRALKRQRDVCNAGRVYLDEMMRLLDSFGLRRSAIQKQLHTGMVGAILQKVFETESDAEMRSGMLAYGIQSSRQQFMAITPRRFGKTTAVAMFVAAFALAVPGSVTAIFSTGRRASNLLLQQIKQMIYAVPGAESKIVSANVETIVLGVNGQQSKISSFPGKAKT
jgi:D-serine deaminase-like pyridoxal phosphate-dependent protein